MSSRRRAVPFDPEFFARRAELGDDSSPLTSFRHAYVTNHWAGTESPSGPGSSLDQTAAVRRLLPQLCERLQVRTLLDIPCGDFSWMSTVDLGPIKYIGGELLPELVEENARRYPSGDFRVLDLLSSPLPAADLVLCRDCLVHFSFADIARAITNLRRAPVTWLLTTTFTDQEVNEEIHTGDWRPLNLQAAPFDWPSPQELLDEECTEGSGIFSDKCLGLWRVSDARPPRRPAEHQS